MIQRRVYCQLHIREIQLGLGEETVEDAVDGSVPGVRVPSSDITLLQHSTVRHGIGGEPRILR